MASREAMLETINRAYEARRTGDIEALMAAFHPDAGFELKGENRLLNLCGRIDGHANVRNGMTAFIGGFAFAKRAILDAIVENDRAVVRSRLRITYTKTRTTFETEILDLFRFKDGKVLELVEFADTALVKDVTGA